MTSGRELMEKVMPGPTIGEALADRLKALKHKADYYRSKPRSSDKDAAESAWVSGLENAWPVIEVALRSAQPEALHIEAEAGKYPMNGHELLAILRGIANDEDRGVDKDRKRGAAHACRRCIAAVESWLRTIPSPLAPK